MKDIKVKLKDSRTLPKRTAFQRMYRLDQSSNILHAKLVIFLIPKSCYAAFLLYSSARVAITKHHRTGGLNNRLLFSRSCGGWKPEIRVPVRSGSDEAPLLQCRLVVSHGRQRARELSGVSFIMPFMKTPLL